MSAPILTIEPNDEWSFIVTGDTKTYKDLLKEKGGQWRPSANGGPKAWRFVNKYRLDVAELINKINSMPAGAIPPKVVVSEYIPVVGDEVMVSHNGKTLKMKIKTVNSDEGDAESGIFLTFV